MSSYYMIITKAIGYKSNIGNEFKCAGFPLRNEIGAKKNSIRDKIVFLVTKESKFMAIAEVIGTYFGSEGQI